MGHSNRFETLKTIIFKHGTVFPLASSKYSTLHHLFIGISYYTLSSIHVCVCVCAPTRMCPWIRAYSYKDLKRKVLLKAKKIGGLEESETLTDEVTDEVSDEDEADPKSLSAENLSAEALCLDKVWGWMDGWR